VAAGNDPFRTFESPPSAQENLALDANLVEKSVVVADYEKSSIIS
jgi:hypothetical protein